MLEESNNALICSLESKTKLWILDSRASFYAISSIELFENYVLGNVGKVYLGDDPTCDVIGKGEMHIKLKESVWNLDNMRHIPNLRKNLISIGQLVKDGYVTTFTSDTWNISGER